MSQEVVSQTFITLLDEFDKVATNDCVTGIAKHDLAVDCKKVRLVAGTIVIDIYWYPLTEVTHQDWYDVTISSVKDSAHFTGSLAEFGASQKIFEDILATSGITIDSKAVKI